MACPDPAFYGVTTATPRVSKSASGEGDADERAEREGYIRAWRQRFSDSLIANRPPLVVFPARASSSTARTPPTATQTQTQTQTQPVPTRPQLSSAPLTRAAQLAISPTAKPFVPSSFRSVACHASRALGRDNEGLDTMTDESPTHESEQEDIVAGFLKRLVNSRVSFSSIGMIDAASAEHQVRYVGIYSPGDFHLDTYRVVVPSVENRRGRGYAGVREEVLLETEERKDIDMLVALIKDLENTANGPLAIRHILNPKQGKDEGLRLVWPRRKKRALPADSPQSPGAPPTPESRPASYVDDAVDTKVSEADTKGAAEMGDWERRDRLIRAGKTVYAEQDEYGWKPDLKMGFMSGMTSPVPFGDRMSPDGGGHMTPVTLMIPVYVPGLCVANHQGDNDEISPINTSPLSIEWPRLS